MRELHTNKEMFDDDTKMNNIPVDIAMQIEETVSLPRGPSLEQQFGDMKFLYQLTNPDSINIDLVYDDLRSHMDRYLNRNITAILTYASFLKEASQFTRLMNLVKLIMRRKLIASQDIIVLIKFCFLIRRLIAISAKYPTQRSLILYRQILDLNSNHYNSSYTNTLIITELSKIEKKFNQSIQIESSQEFPFCSFVLNPTDNPLAAIYIGELLKIEVLDLIKQNFPSSIDLLANIQKYVLAEIVQAILPLKEVLERVESYFLAVPNDNQTVSKQQIEHILKWTERLCSDGSLENRQRITEMELHIASIFLKSPSIDKKLWALSVINDKIRMIKQGMLQPTQMLNFLEWLQSSGLYDSLIKQNVHSEVLARSSQFVRFLYERQRLNIAEIEELISITIKSDTDAICKFAHCLIIVLEYRHLQRVFEIIALHTHETKHVCTASIKLIESILYSQFYYAADKKTKRKRTHSGTTKQKTKSLKEDQMVLAELNTDMKQPPQEGEGKSEPSPLTVRIFNFIVSHMDQFPVNHLIPRIVSAQPVIFTMIPQEIVNAVRDDRPNCINFIDTVMKIQMPPGPKEKWPRNKNELVSWLSNQGIFQYLLAGIARNRFDKSLPERLNTVLLLGRYHRPFEKTYVEFMWKILGLRAQDEKQREQFFVFVKDCLTKGNNQPLFTQQAINYIFFDILLRLHARWFSIKIYQCFEMFFLRLNQDCKLVNYLSGSPTVNYQLIDPQLIGFNKFWYIYLSAEDIKVVKRCRQFLCRLVSKFDCEEKVNLLMKQQYINMILKHIRDNIDLIKKHINVDNYGNRCILVMGRSLQLLIKIIEQLEGKRISGDKQVSAETLTFNIVNRLKDAMPAKNFQLTVSTTTTLKGLRELIGAKLNPPKKANQIRLMVQGRFAKGQNLTMKQLRFQNKFHFFVDMVEQIQPEVQKIDQKLLEDMKMMFPNHSASLIEYVLFKRQGEDEQAIAEVMLDDQAMTKYSQQMQESTPAANKMISQLISSSQNIFETFFQVLGLESQQLSLLTWKIISNIPNNPFHNELIRQTILKTNDWNEIISLEDGNLFKTLYNLQLLKSMLNQSADQMELGDKFVEGGGFEHTFKTLKAVMHKWAGDTLQAKLITSLMQVVKVYLKPHLQSRVKKPLSYLYKQVSNYRNHLKDIAQDSINHIIEEIVTPQQTNTAISNKEKSFSFKARSISSNQTPTNQTPNFQSVNNSRSNSPHSERPIQKEEDNLSSISGSKSAKFKRNDGKMDGFSVKIQQNVNLQLQMHNTVNICEVVQLILQNLGKIVKTQGLADNQDVISLADELFDVLFPSLLVDSVHQNVYENEEIIRVIVQGVGMVNDEQFRIKLVYLVFLLCVINDTINENRVMVEDDDELFLTSGMRGQGPKVYFIQQLLPLFYSQKNLHQSFFICLTKLIKQVNTGSQLQHLFSPEALAKQAVEAMLNRPTVEQHDNDTEDYTLNGLLALIQVILERYPQLKKRYAYIVGDIFNFLFHLPENQEEMQNTKSYPKCKRKCTRRRCLNLLLEIVRDEPESRKMLIQLISKYCQGLSPKEYESTVMRTQKYPGLRNLGATCYINSLLQQIHKNTLLGQMLCSKEIIQIDKGQPLFLLAHLMSSLSHSIRNTINPAQFIKSVRFHGDQEINPVVQQDVNEFFMAFVDLLQKNNAQSLMGATLLGQICNQLSGQDDQRKFVKKSMEKFYTISLDIKGKRSLTEALQYYIKADVLDGDNMYYSQELGKKVRATKRSYVRKLPNCLVLTLKRFEFDYNSMLRLKLNDYLQFPVELDMFKFSQQYLSEESENIFDEGYYKYRLAGVLVHMGTAESGHYYSYIRDSDKWYEFNDSAVTEFNIANLKAETFGEDSPVKGVNDWESSSNRSRSAYLLFYQRLQPIQNPLSLQVKDKQIKGEFLDLVWRENLQFLKSRLVFDSDFIKFSEDLFEISKDNDLQKLLMKFVGDIRREPIKTDVEIQEMNAIEQKGDTWVCEEEDKKLHESLNERNHEKLQK